MSIVVKKESRVVGVSNNAACASNVFHVVLHVPVERGFLHIGDLFDLLEGVFSGGVQPQSLVYLFLFGPGPSADTSPGTGCVQPLSGAFFDGIPFKLRYGAHKGKQQLAGRGAGVDGFFEAHQMHTLFLKELHKLYWGA